MRQERGCKDKYMEKLTLATSQLIMLIASSPTHLCQLKMGALEEYITCFNGSPHNKLVKLSHPLNFPRKNGQPVKEPYNQNGGRSLSENIKCTVNNSSWKPFGCMRMANEKCDSPS
jgi:hypothetical protein